MQINIGNRIHEFIGSVFDQMTRELFLPTGNTRASSHSLTHASMRISQGRPTRTAAKDDANIPPVSAGVGSGVLMGAPTRFPVCVPAEISDTARSLAFLPSVCMFLHRVNLEALFSITEHFRRAHTANPVCGYICTLYNYAYIGDLDRFCAAYAVPRCANPTSAVFRNNSLLYADARAIVESGMNAERETNAERRIMDLSLDHVCDYLLVSLSALRALHQRTDRAVYVRCSLDNAEISEVLPGGVTVTVVSSDNA